MKSLNAIQTLSKIGKIMSKITYICSIVAAAVCVVGLVSLPFIGNDIIKIGGVTLHSLIVNNENVSMASIGASIAEALIVAVGEIVLARYAYRYFANELNAGTPFTADGAKELMRLGILTISVPLGTQIIAEIVCAVISEASKDVMRLQIDNSSSVALGVMFIIMSVFCRYGSELLEGSIKTEEKQSK